jgi:hypothetical protein
VPVKFAQAACLCTKQLEKHGTDLFFKFDTAELHEKLWNHFRF